MAFGDAMFHDSETENKLFIKNIKDPDQSISLTSNVFALPDKQSGYFNYLSDFYIWLNNQIKVGNRQFILGEIHNNAKKNINLLKKNLFFY